MLHTLGKVGKNLLMKLIEAVPKELCVFWFEMFHFRRSGKLQIRIFGKMKNDLA